MFSGDFLEQVRRASPMEQVAGHYVQLHRQGRLYGCKCPFHSDKSPSCMIYPDTQSFYCFGCQVGGDVFEWIKRIENVEFNDAVRILAEQAGLDIPTDRETQERAKMLVSIYSINRESANFYYRTLLHGEDKRGLYYFKERRLLPETVKKYGLGFAPDAWDSLSSYLLQKGFSEQQLLTAMVSKRSARGTLYDMFRNRVMFPIIDLKGSVIGFGGRVMDDSKPKYLNTAGTPVFDKGKNLFSLNFAVNAPTKTIILCEGYMDVIAVNQAGFSNIVATLGTAITPDQARLLSRYADSIILAYDADEAGRKAAKTAINRFNEVGLPVRALHIEGAKDPDEYIRRNGKERFRMLLEKSIDAVDFQLARCADGLDMQDAQQKTRYLRRVIEVLADIDDPVARDVYLGRMAEKADFPAQTLQIQLEQALKRKNRKEKERSWQQVVSRTVSPYGETLSDEKRHIKRLIERILYYLIRCPEEMLVYAQQITDISVDDEVWQKLQKTVQDCIEGGYGFSFSVLSPILTDEQRSQISRFMMTEEVPVSKQEFVECLNGLRRKQISVEDIRDNDALLALMAQKKRGY